MKTLYFLFALLTMNAIAAFADEVEITPLFINYWELTQIGDETYALGDVGCAVVSRDSGRSWTRIRPFKRGNILLLYKLDNEYIAVNSLGQIATASAVEKQWDVRFDLNLRLTSAIQFPEGLFLRSDSALYAISNNFQITAETPFVIRNRRYGDFDTINPRKSLAFLNDKLIAETDTSTFVRLDKALNVIDTLSLKKLNIINDTSYYGIGYDIRTSGETLYFSFDKIVKSEAKWNHYKSIYKTKDFINIDLVADYPIKSLYTLKSGNVYYTYIGSKSLIDTSFISWEGIVTYSKSILPLGDNILIAGRYGLLRTLNTKDSSIKIYSDAYLTLNSNFPESIGDSTLLYFSGMGNTEFPTSISSLKGIDALPNTPKKNFSAKDRTDRYAFYFKYFDDVAKRICLIGQDKDSNKAVVFTSDDLGVHYTKRYIENLTLKEMAEYIENALETPNIHKYGDRYAAVMSYKGGNDLKNAILLFDSDFNFVKKITLSNLVIDYVVPIDSLSFIIHDVNPKDSRSEIKFTSDGGKKWTSLVKYPTFFKNALVQEFELNHKKYLGVVHLNQQDSIKMFETIDLETREIDTIATWRVTVNEYGSSSAAFSITYDDSFLYMTFKDTLFAINNLYERGSWRKRILPYNGYVSKIKKIGDKFISAYNDRYIQDRPGFFWIEPEIPLSANDEGAQVERVNYLYCFPPYPVPAKNEVRALIYWDTSLDIDKDDISVYNLFSKVAGREDITIEKTMPYSGYLVWNCSRYEPGVYFIVVNHGDAHWLIKAIVE